MNTISSHPSAIRVISLAAVLLLGTAIVLDAQTKGRILMIIRPGDPTLADFMLTKEVAVMRSALTKAGYLVVVATATGQPVTGQTASVAADIRISQVKVKDYKGVILPCMAAGGSPVAAEAVDVVKKAVASRVPVAAQNSAVEILNQAGVLKGKRYAVESGLAAIVSGGTYAGIGVVVDGNIVTSGTCPFMAKQLGKPDGTADLTQKLISLVR